MINTTFLVVKVNHYQLVRPLRIGNELNFSIQMSRKVILFLQEKVSRDCRCVRLNEQSPFRSRIFFNVWYD
jgi:hypothetical protein